MRSLAAQYCATRLRTIFASTVEDLFQKLKYLIIHTCNAEKSSFKTRPFVVLLCRPVVAHPQSFMQQFI